MLNRTNVPPKQTEPCPTALLYFIPFSFSSPLSAGLKGSLQRMQLEYVDVVFANRPDSNTPMEGRWLLDAQRGNFFIGAATFADNQPSLQRLALPLTF